MIRLIAFFTTCLASANFTATLINDFDSRKAKQSIEIDAAFFIYNSCIGRKAIYGRTKKRLPTIPEYHTSQKINFVNSQMYNPNSASYQPTAAITSITAYVQYYYFDESGRRSTLLTNTVVPTAVDQLDFVFKLVNDDKARHGLNLLQY